jgi:hypothetical protein
MRERFAANDAQRRQRVGRKAERGERKAHQQHLRDPITRQRPSGEFRHNYVGIHFPGQRLPRVFRSLQRCLQKTFRLRSCVG